MVSKQMKNAIKILLNRREKNIIKRIEDIRIGDEDFASLIKVAKDVKIEYVNVNGIPSAWISTPEVDRKYVILYLHGGGYVSGSIKTHQELVSRISRVTKARALLIEYRLAPEHVFPAALEDTISAYQWLINTEGIKAKNVIIAGDSVGGGLVLATLVKLRDSGMVLPSAAVCLSPNTDLTLTSESIRKNAKFDPFVTTYDLDFNITQYIGNADPRNPLLSPLYADLKGLPPILIQVGTTEILIDDSIRFAERGKTGGTEIILDIWEDAFHVFQIAAAIGVPESEQAINKIGTFTQRFFV